ncbi:C1 family peptidase [Spirosoma montaniterrae]|uniref:Peptidase C1A papain C-terminal domain-containing protein n=1 Tax=Spirosoma montaniterrae TaxID=1178516 RepID=A0A1P9WYS2_9BACT|nr:C1 family peptidase [Spirosoma montaniterrae]AQG80525.1 hypothetical protein AWR27_15065 [Spirosoma montaniterrae]
MKPTLFLIALSVWLTANAQEPPARKYTGGLKINRTRSLTVLTKAPLATRSFANLPAEVSYEAFCPSVGDQGKQETSVAFATAYYLRTIMEGREQNMTQKAQLDQARFSPTFVYDKIRDPKDVNCQEGGTIEEALDVLKVDGVPRLRTLSYPQCAPKIPANAVQEAAKFRIGDYQQLFAANAPADQKVLAVKKALSEGNPVVVGIGAPLSFEEVRAVWEPAPNEKISDALYNQAICVIGYSDKQYGGAFRIVNSWNTKWGEKGFCWIPYSYFGKFVLNAFQVYSTATASAPEPVTASATTPTSVVLNTGVRPDTRRGSAELRLNDGATMAMSRQAMRTLKVEADEAAPTTLRAYRTTTIYPSGTRFKFYLTNSENAYVYALTVNKRGDFDKLFPFDDLTSPLLGPNTTIVYPGEKTSVVIESSKTSDYLLILFAKRPLNPDGLIKALDRKRGPIDKRINEVLGDQLVQPDEVKYEDEQIAFAVKSGISASIVPVLIEIRHK